jgi:hypothetical protein
MTGTAKRIHVIWLAPGAVPERVARHIGSWKRLHPRWEVTLWREEEIMREDLRPESLNPLRSPLERSQLIRLELLLRHGGVVVDPLLECVGPIDALCDAESLTVLERADGGIDDGLLAAAAGDSLIEEALRSAQPREFWGNDLSGTNGVLLSGILDGVAGVRRVPPAYIVEGGAEMTPTASLIDHRAEVRFDERDRALFAERALATAQKEVDQERDALDKVRAELARAEAEIAARARDAGLVRRILQVVRRPTDGEGN